MRRATLQSGLFGAALATLLNFVALLPYIGFCIALPLLPIAFFLTGLALVRVADEPPSVGQAAVGGAVAGLVAGTIAGLVAMFLAPIRVALAGGPESLTWLLSPELSAQLVARGLDPVAVVDFMAKAGLGLLLCSGQMLIGALLAASAAALYAAFRQP